MDFTSITNSWGYILSGAAYTVQLTAITAVGGLFLGTLLALCHISEKRWLSAPAKLYINLMRAVPLVLVQPFASWILLTNLTLANAHLKNIRSWLLLPNLKPMPVTQDSMQLELW